MKISIFSCGEANHSGRCKCSFFLMKKMQIFFLSHEEDAVVLSFSWSRANGLSFSQSSKEGPKQLSRNKHCSISSLGHRVQIWCQIWPLRMFGDCSGLKSSRCFLVSDWWNFLIFSQRTNFSKVYKKISTKILISPKKIKFPSCQPQLYSVRTLLSKEHFKVLAQRTVQNKERVRTPHGTEHGYPDHQSNCLE